MDKNPRNHNFRAKIISEGYCCEYGYLKLCLARGQAPRNMGPALNLSRCTIYDHLRKLNAGDYSCRNAPDCLNPVIHEILAEPQTRKRPGQREEDN